MRGNSSYKYVAHQTYLEIELRYSCVMRIAVSSSDRGV